MRENKCQYPNCSKDGQKNKDGYYRKYCSKHKMQVYRENNPISAAFQTLRHNAKRRGKVFEITLKYFTDFVIRSGYMEGKGKLSDSLHIDRDNEELGYIEGNLAVRTNADNRKKYVDYWKNKKQDEGDIIVGDLDEVNF